jgi:hypothetical protein
MWSPVMKMHVPANVSNLVVARIQTGSTNRSLSVIVNNTGPGNVNVGSVFLQPERCLVSTITSGDLTITPNPPSLAADIELQFSDRP